MYQHYNYNHPTTSYEDFGMEAHNPQDERVLPLLGATALATPFLFGHHGYGPGHGHWHGHHGHGPGHGHRHGHHR